MTNEGRLERALSRLPGDLQVTGRGVAPNTLPCHNGLDGETWHLGQPDATPLFLKLLDADLHSEFNAVVHASTMAARRGIAPAVVSFDAGFGFVLFENPGASWRSASALDFCRPAVRAAAVGLVREWHASSNLGRASPSLVPILQDGLSRWQAELSVAVDMWSSLVDWGQLIEAALQRHPRLTVPLHRELFLANFLVGTDDRMLLSDFDHAADGDAYEDLGALVLEFCDDEAGHAEILSLYGEEVTDASLARVRLRAILEDMRWGLWSWARFKAGRDDGSDYLTYARYRFARAAAHLGTWDPGRLCADLRS